MTAVAVVTNTEKMPRKESRRLRRALADAGFSKVEYLEVSRGSDTKAAAAKAVRKHGADTVVVCGGDGSVRAAAEALVGTQSVLAVVPCGTANLFASGLDLPTDIDDIVQLVASGQRRTIDTVDCNGHTFCVMAGVGFDVSMLDGAEDGKERMGTLAYVTSGVRAARRRTLFETTVSLDGEALYEGRASCLLVGNGGRLKAGLEAFPGATPTDGMLHLAIVTAAGLREWGGLLASAIARKPEWSRNAHLAQGRKVVVEFDKKQRFELDGGVKTTTKRLEFRIRPRSLHVAAPLEAAAA